MLHPCEKDKRLLSEKRDKVNKKTALIAFIIALVLAVLTDGLDLLMYPIAFVLLGVTAVLYLLDEVRGR